MATNVEALKNLYVTLGGNAADVADRDSNSEMIEALRNVAGGGGGGESPFTYVRFTHSGSGSTCDKTFAELSALLEAATPVMAYDEYGPLCLTTDRDEGGIIRIYATQCTCSISEHDIVSITAYSYIYSADGIADAWGSKTFTN